MAETETKDLNGDQLLAMFEQTSIAEPASQRAAELYQVYERWATQTPEKSADSNADANRRPRGF
jgi:hypothetical protein